MHAFWGILYTRLHRHDSLPVSYNILQQNSSGKMLNKQDAIGDGRLCSQCRHMTNWMKQHRTWFWPIGPIMLKHDIITSSTKLELHSILHLRQSRTKPRPQVICTENWWKLDRWFLRYACGQTDRQTDIHIRRSQYFAHLTGAK